ncbi:MAG: hypothetical protein WBK77_05530 [Alphaproteobacteria bacterium]
MNDFIRFISKSLEPFGYHVRPRNGLNFLRVPNLEKDGSIDIVRRAMSTPCPVPPEGNLDRLVIYLRTCLREKRNIDTRPRCTGVSMTEHSLRCIYSLILSANALKDISVELRVLDDHSDETPLAALKNILTHAQFPVALRTTTEQGQGASLHEQFSMGRMDDAITYFCEDDFLHEEDGLAVMVKFYQDMARLSGSHLVLYPMEHNSLYSHHYPSYIVAGADRHWRSVRHATHTFLTHGKAVEKYWRYFENTKYVGNRKKRKLGSEAQTTNNLFRFLPGFSPLKPCAVHLQFKELLPPFYDWRALWERSNLPMGI